LTILLAVVAGALYAGGIYMIMRRVLVKLIIGLALLANASNLLIFVAAGLTRGRPPLVPPGGALDYSQVADPVPQALVLTAIVIGFGVLAFALALVQRTYEAVGSDDLDEIRSTDL
jgi:multicomponent Na+:H+ antiporter subunit C